MRKREQISKKIRFEVFKRDGFICQYCGKTPPEVTLEIDHLKPVSKKGTDNINNLITACFDCNRGKRNIELDKLPNTVNQNFEILKEQQDQLKEYQKLINKIEKKLNIEIEQVNTEFKEWWTNRELTEKFKKTTVKMFIKKIGVTKTKDAMNQACSKMNTSNDSIKYFCGICWKIIKGEVYDGIN